MKCHECNYENIEKKIEKLEDKIEKLKKNVKESTKKMRSYSKPDVIWNTIKIWMIFVSVGTLILFFLKFELGIYQYYTNNTLFFVFFIIITPICVAYLWYKLFLLENEKKILAKETEKSNRDDEIL